MPETALENRITSQWGEIGFQGKNPETDFRGMGMITTVFSVLVCFHCSYEQKLCACQVHHRLLLKATKQLC